MSSRGLRREFDLLIVGAGVVGAVMASLAVARRLAEPGRIALLADSLPAAGERQAPADEWDPRVFALSRAAQRLLEGCGIWETLPRERVHAYQRMCVWDAGGAPEGAGSLVFDCAEIGEPDLGHIVDGAVLQGRCLAAARAAGVALIEARLTGLEVEEGGVRVSLHDGRELLATLVVGADGTGSPTRALLGIETAGHAYHQDALVGHVRTAQPHRATAWQRFLPTGPLAFLPLPDGRSSIVWSAPRAEAARLRALDPQDFSAELTAASGAVLGDCTITTPLAAFPLKLQYAVAYVGPRAVLIGDAAHAVHPLAGQGLNLGLLDCAALAEVLAAAAHPGELGDRRFLRRYERWRRGENLLAAGTFDALERLFGHPNPAFATLRAAGLGAVGRIPFLTRGLAAQALGLAGDLPAFLRDDRSWPRR